MIFPGRPTYVRRGAPAIARCRSEDARHPYAFNRARDGYSATVHFNSDQGGGNIDGGEPSSPVGDVMRETLGTITPALAVQVLPGSSDSYAE